MMPKSSHKNKSPLGKNLADRVASTIGSWRFIISQSIFIAFWIIVNVNFRGWDPYPFIFLDLTLSFQAAYTVPMIMMSQNRQAEKDRKRAAADYRINLLAEREIEMIMKSLIEIDQKITKHQEIQSEIAEVKTEVKLLQSILDTKGRQKT